MTIDKSHQRLIVIALGAAVFLYVGIFVLLLPYLSSRQDYAEKIAKAQERQRHDDDLIANNANVSDKWAKLTSDTLMTDEASSVIMLHDKFYEWSGRTGFDLQNLSHEKPLQKGDFQQIKFQITGQARTESLGRFLQAIERSNLPLQIDDVAINSRKDHDDLLVTVRVMTIIFHVAPPAHRSSTPQSGDDL